MKSFTYMLAILFLMLISLAKAFAPEATTISLSKSFLFPSFFSEFQEIVAMEDV